MFVEVMPDIISGIETIVKIVIICQKRDDLKMMIDVLNRLSFRDNLLENGTIDRLENKNRKLVRIFVVFTTLTVTFLLLKNINENISHSSKELLFPAE
jgi:hypothetical protein